MHSRRDVRIANPDALLLRKKTCECSPGLRVRLLKISSAWESSDQHGSSLPEFILDGGNGAIRIPTNGFTGSCPIRLLEISSTYRMLSEPKCQVFQQVGSKVHVCFHYSEELLQNRIRLHGAGVSPVSEVSGCAFADERAPILHVFP